jgi:hypothetical protein
MRDTLTQLPYMGGILECSQQAGIVVKVVHKKLDPGVVGVLGVVCNALLHTAST